MQKQKREKLRVPKLSTVQLKVIFSDKDSEVDDFVVEWNEQMGKVNGGTSRKSRSIDHITVRSKSYNDQMASKKVGFDTSRAPGNSKGE